MKNAAFKNRGPLAFSRVGVLRLTVCWQSASRFFSCLRILFLCLAAFSKKAEFFQHTSAILNFKKSISKYWPKRLLSFRPLYLNNLNLKGVLFNIIRNAFVSWNQKRKQKFWRRKENVQIYEKVKSKVNRVKLTPYKSYQFVTGRAGYAQFCTAI